MVENENSYVQIVKSRLNGIADGMVIFIFFGGGWGLNPELCIYYALSVPTELS